MSHQSPRVVVMSRQAAHPVTAPPQMKMSMLEVTMPVVVSPMTSLRLTKKITSM